MEAGARAMEAGNTYRFMTVGMAPASLGPLGQLLHSYVHPIHTRTRTKLSHFLRLAAV